MPRAPQPYHYREQMCELSPPASTDADADADADAIAFLLWLCTSLTTPLILTQSHLCAASGSKASYTLRGPLVHWGKGYYGRYAERM